MGLVVIEPSNRRLPGRHQGESWAATCRGGRALRHDEHNGVSPSMSCSALASRRLRAGRVAVRASASAISRSPPSASRRLRVGRVAETVSACAILDRMMQGRHHRTRLPARCPLDAPRMVSRPGLRWQRVHRVSASVRVGRMLICWSCWVMLLRLPGEAGSGAEIACRVRPRCLCASGCVLSY